jgi:type IV pilus assembly protein PilC
MSTYAYRAVDGTGRVLNGQLGAASENDLDSRLLQIGLQLISCKELRGARKSGGAVSRKELINLCFHLEQSQRAGLPILEALRDLRDGTDDPQLRNVVAALSMAVEGGQSLSTAMEDFPGTFDAVFVNLIRAGEKSGELAAVLARMTETLKWQDELLAQTKKLVMYPAFVGTVVMGVVFFLMIYVVPQMTEFLKNMGQEIPVHTRALIATSAFLSSYWYLVLATPVILAFAYRYFFRTNIVFRRWADGMKLRVWYVGPIVERICMSRFTTYFQIMYASGISVVDALKTSRELAGNVVIAEALDRVHAYVGEGNSFGNAIQRAEIFPRLVVRMIRMGEDIGKLDDALKNVGYFYNREVEESIGRLQSMIEPAMTVILGLILGWVMMSVLGPIYETISNIQT